MRFHCGAGSPAVLRVQKLLKTGRERLECNGGSGDPRISPEDKWLHKWCWVGLLVQFIGFCIIIWRSEHVCTCGAVFGKTQMRYELN